MNQGTQTADQSTQTESVDGYIGTKYVLSIDGGGVKIKVGTEILAQIEEEMGIDIYNHFDLFAGVSAGAGFCTSVVYSGMTPRAIQNRILKRERFSEILYVPQKSGIKKKLINMIDTNQILLEPKYDSKIFENFVKTYYPLGPFRMKESGLGSKPMMILNYNISKSKGTIWKNWEQREYYPSITDLLMSTGSLPPFLCPRKIKYNSLYDSSVDDDYYIDGAFVTNTPAFYAWVEAKKLWKNHRIKVLSIGNTIYTKNLKESDGILKWGLYQWSTRGNMSGILCNSEAQLSSNCLEKILGSDYLRISGISNYDLFDYDINSLESMTLRGIEMFNSNRYSLRQFFADS